MGDQRTRNVADGGGATRGRSHYGCRLQDGTQIFDDLVTPAETPVDFVGEIESHLKVPEKRLLLGVLSEAWDSAFGSDRLEREEARAWFLEESDPDSQTAGFTFAQIAGELGLRIDRELLARRFAAGVKFPPSARTQVCSTCNEEQSVVRFHVHKRTGYRRPDCASCVSKRRRARRTALKVAA